MVYYNEIDPYAAQWLRNLIAAGHIAPGDVDERSITDVRPADLAGYTQCHFFAGIGVWSHALRLAGWPDSRPVWTGSCPCQPFSAAGKGAGTADARHLWPVWFNLIRECRPDTVFGEQVEAAVRHGWLDLVQSDMEGEGYAFAPVGIPAAGVGAPHIRQRLWFVADATGIRQPWRGQQDRGGESGERPAKAIGGAVWEQVDERVSAGLLANTPSHRQQRPGAGGATEEGRQPRSECAGQLPDGSEGLCADGLLAHPDDAGSQGHRRPVGQHAEAGREDAGRHGAEGGVLGGVADAARIGKRANESRSDSGNGQQLAGSEQGRDGGDNGTDARQEPATRPPNTFWSTADWLLCGDGKFRPVEPGTQPLVNGAASRVGRLRAYGNAIVPQVAAEVIGAFLES